MGKQIQVVKQPRPVPQPEPDPPPVRADVLARWF